MEKMVKMRIGAMSQKNRVGLSDHRRFVGHLSRREMILSGAAAAMTSALGTGIGTAQVASTTTIAPFRVAVPQVALDDLKRRLGGRSDASTARDGAALHARVARA